MTRLAMISLTSLLLIDILTLVTTSKRMIHDRLSAKINWRTDVVDAHSLMLQTPFTDVADAQLIML